MALNEQPPHGENEFEDNAIHVRDPEDAPASSLQITIVVLALIAILSVFFYGVNNQRVEIAGSPPPAAPQGQSPQSPSPNATTGQSSETQTK